MNKNNKIIALMLVICVCFYSCSKESIYISISDGLIKKTPYKPEKGYYVRLVRK